MNIKIIYEDDNLLVIDKPANVIVHPGAGLPDETLVDWFSQKYPETKKFDWPDPERPGIVHRLDKDTSGLIILAKNPTALEKMQALFSSRQIKKSYLALVFGKLEKPDGEISGFIGRDPHHRREQTAKTIHFDFLPGKMREAKTYYRTLKQYRFGPNDLTLVEATIETGRTHQIRVHFKFLGHPIIGDQTYNIKHSRQLSKALAILRQFLHSYRLEFKNPFDNEEIKLEIPLPKDLKEILAKLS